MWLIYRKEQYLCWYKGDFWRLLNSAVLTIQLLVEHFSQSITRKTGQYTQHKTKKVCFKDGRNRLMWVHQICLIFKQHSWKMRKTDRQLRKKRRNTVQFSVLWAFTNSFRFSHNYSKLFIDIEIDILKFLFFSAVIENNCHVTIYLIIMLNSLILIIYH